MLTIKCSTIDYRKIQIQIDTDFFGNIKIQVWYSPDTGLYFSGMNQHAWIEYVQSYLIHAWTKYRPVSGLYQTCILILLYQIDLYFQTVVWFRPETLLAVYSVHMYMYIIHILHWPELCYCTTRNTERIGSLLCWSAQGPPLAVHYQPLSLPGPPVSSPHRYWVA